eukprot:GHUV01009061.1.p1 GENE.GHUV01009061.1~~GHUV01009061.1.p1  ORF type:complete len:460 (+),score=166.15 GHUV01009061.1:529-1908(+)
MPISPADAGCECSELGSMTTNLRKCSSPLMGSRCISQDARSHCGPQPLQVQECCGRVHVQHIPQLYNWDCGLACVLMVLRALGCANCDFQQLRRLSQTTSVWTVDLAHLLAHFGASVTFTTITVGINNDYANEWFYMEHLEHDELRVQQLFQQAEQLGIVVQQRSLDIAELIAAVSSGNQLAIMLVDRRKIDPWQAAADMAWNYTTGVTSATGYTGHYILVVGYEAPSAAAAAASTEAAAKSSGSNSRRSSNCSDSSHSGCVTQQELTQPVEQLVKDGQPVTEQQPGPEAPLQQSQQQGQAQQASGEQFGTAQSVSGQGQPAPAAAPDSPCKEGGHFWVHDPACSHGPVRVPVSIVESARKTFGTDEDILLIDVKPLAPAADVQAAAATLQQQEEQQEQLGLQQQEVACSDLQRQQQCAMCSDMQRSRSGQCHDHSLGQHGVRSCGVVSLHSEQPSMSE